MFVRRSLPLLLALLAGPACSLASPPVPSVAGSRVVGTVVAPVLFSVNAPAGTSVTAIRVARKQPIGNVVTVEGVVTTPSGVTLRMRFDSPTITLPPASMTMFARSLVDGLAK